MIGRCRNSIESKPKDLSSTLKFELELDGFPHPFINWATLPVIDGFIQLIRAYRRLGIAKAGLALVHDRKLDLPSFWGVVA
jgi:hypothetical protein